MSTTYEEAKKCGKCNLPGEEVRLTPVPKAARLPIGTKVATIKCRTEGCPNFNEVSRIITIRPDGTIPDPIDHTGKPKVYMGIEGHDEMATRLIDQLKRNAEAETQPSTPEIRFPR